MAATKGVPSYVIMSAAAVAALAVGYWLFGTGAPSPTDLQSQLRAGELADQQRERAEKVAIARVSQQRAVDTGTRALELLDVALREETLWSTQVEPLMTNQEGRVLGADDTLVASFVAVYQEKRPSRAELEAARPRIEALLKEPKAALDDPAGSAYQPADALLAELEKERASLEAASRAYKTSREKVESLLAGARMNGTQAGGIPLEQAIREQAARDTLLAASAESARKERQRLEEEQKQAAIDEALHQERLRSMDAQAEADRLALEKQAATEQRARAQQAERERLQSLASDPAVQAKFQPFLAEGMVKITAPNSGWKHEYPMGASYRALQSKKVLSDFEEFWKCGTGWYPCRANDRPPWAKPTSKEGWDDLRERFALFQQLAPIWAEQGKLSP